LTLHTLIVLIENATGRDQTRASLLKVSDIGRETPAKNLSGCAEQEKYTDAQPETRRVRRMNLYEIERVSEWGRVVETVITIAEDEAQAKRFASTYFRNTGKDTVTLLGSTGVVLYNINESEEL